MSVLPVSREDIEHELEAIKEEEANVNMKVRTTDTIVEQDEGIDDEETTPLIKKKEELFDIPIDEKPKKKKRQLSQAQLDNLKKAREKSVAKRKALKEARDLEKQSLILQRRRVREEKDLKKEEQEQMIALKAQLLDDAKREATWDEARLATLMEKTLDNYIEKKRKAKPVPRAVVPPPVQTQPAVQSRYYNPTQPAQSFNQGRYSAPPQQRMDPNNAYHQLFGNYGGD